MFINDHRGRLDLERFGIRVQPAKFDSPRAGDGAGVGVGLEDGGR